MKVSIYFVESRISGEVSARSGPHDLGIFAQGVAQIGYGTV